jgi:phospholipid/cholesterol/gamma-HCH transport system substrate-binding protein
MKLSNEIKVGLLAILTLIASIWGFKFLKAQNMIGHSVNLLVEYANTQQLTKSSPVTYHGVNIGSVADIYFKPGGSGNAIVVLNIKQYVPIPKNALAALRVDGLLSGRSVELFFAKPCEGGDCAQSGDFLTGETWNMMKSVVGPPSVVKEYTDVLNTGIAGIVDTLSMKLGNPDSETGKSLKDIQLTIANLKASTNALNQLMAASSNNIKGILQNVNTLTADLNQSTYRIKNVLANTDSFTLNLSKTDLSKTNNNANDAIASLKKTLETTEKLMAELNGVSAKLSKGDGSLGLLMNDRKLYDNINTTMTQVQLLSQDIRLNPRRYVNLNVFKSYKPYTAPENDPAQPYLAKRDSIH